MIRFVLAAALCTAPMMARAADPTPNSGYPTGPNNSSVLGVVPMGLDASGFAVPCGSSTVAFGCNTLGLSSATSITTNISGTTSATPSTAAIAVAAAVGRTYLVVTNTSTTATIYLGSSSVTGGSGIPLAPGGGYLFTGAIAGGVLYAISSTSSVSFAYAGG